MSDLATLADVDAVKAVVRRYARAIDAHDLEGVCSCFTDDVESVGHDQEGNETVASGIDVLRDRLARVRDAATLPVDRITRSTHLLANTLVHVDGATARAESAVCSYLTGPRGTDTITLVRGFTYTDDLVRTDTGWRIRRRSHDLKWMCEATPVVAGG